MARKSDTVQETFLKACNENNLVKVNACIQLEVDINCEVVNREFVTLDDNEEEVFKDFDQDMNGFHGSTGLHIAAKKGFSELVDILLAHPNIECNILDNYGRTPLLCASTVEILQKLLDDDRVDVNVANSQSESVLFTAMGFITLGQIKILQAKQFILWNLKKGRSGGIALEEFCRLGKYKHLDAILSAYRDNGSEIGYDLNSISDYIPRAVLECEDDELTLKCLKVLAKEPKIQWNERKWMSGWVENSRPLEIAMRRGNQKIFNFMMSIPAVNKEAVFPNLHPMLKNCLQEKEKEKPKKRPRVPTLECPVCANDIESGDNVHQCKRGHFLCENCGSRVKKCPECRGKVVGRAFGFEKFFASLKEEMVEDENENGQAG